MYSSQCDAPNAWDNPKPEDGVIHTELGPSFFASSYVEARRELSLLGWFVAEDGKTYCPFHAENARRLDAIARKKARSL